MTLPQWVVLHVPHDSTDVPDAVRDQFPLDDLQLRAEIDRMTDHHTLALFAEPESQAAVVRASVSRLVVDVERFAEDEQEPMSKRGMGAIYTATSQLTPLRRALSAEERAALMRAYYHPHHQRLEAAVDSTLERFDRCLIIDCHSFPDRPLSYEMSPSDLSRPEICIGADEFHTSEELLNAFVAEFGNAGWTVSVNDPFAGSIVPSSRYRRDRRVQSIMVEVNRRLYLEGVGPKMLADFSIIANKIKLCCMRAIEAWGS